MTTKIILFGTPSFSLPIADMLLHYPDGKLVAVITAPDSPSGRGKHLSAPKLKVWAQDNAIKILQPQKLDSAFIENISALNPTVGVIASFGKIVQQEILNVFPKGIINVHPSLLPRHRGASPVQTTILSGDSTAGITLMLTDKEMDHGPIIAQKNFPIWPQETAQELKMRLAEHGAKFLMETLPQWLQGNIEPKEQKHEHATFTKTLTRDDGEIVWNEPIELIERKIRAYDPWPGAFTHTPDGKRLKILFIEIENAPNAETGTVSKSEDGTLMIRASDGWAKLIRVQMEGKAVTDGKSFLNGHQSLIGLNVD